MSEREKERIFSVERQRRAGLLWCRPSVVLFGCLSRVVFLAILLWFCLVLSPVVFIANT